MQHKRSISAFYFKYKNIFYNNNNNIQTTIGHQHAILQLLTFSMEKSFHILIEWGFISG